MPNSMIEQDMQFIRDPMHPERLPVIYVAGVDRPVHSASSPTRATKRWWQFWK